MVGADFFFSVPKRQQWTNVGTSFLEHLKQWFPPGCKSSREGLWCEKGITQECCMSGLCISGILEFWYISQSRIVVFGQDWAPESVGQPNACEAISLEAIHQDLVDWTPALGPAHQSVQVGPLAVWRGEDCSAGSCGQNYHPSKFSGTTFLSK